MTQIGVSQRKLFSKHLLLLPTMALSFLHTGNKQASVKFSPCQFRILRLLEALGKLTSMIQGPFLVLLFRNLVVLVRSSV
mmetsp:Transcript_62573/g.93038  ORF Transcript_62573/g.93038 Transcript_62573/m.93038 type:complete len:80 (+) Transcript_62573:1109-1348(+)